MPPSRDHAATIRAGGRTFRWLAAALVLVVCALPAAAQRGGGGTRAGRGAGLAMLGDPSPTLQAADVARLDPIAMLIDEGRDMGLPDSVRMRLDSLRRDLAQRNYPLLGRLDSLLAAFRAAAADTTGTEGDRLMRAGDRRQAFAVILGRIRDNDDEAALTAMDYFSGRSLRWAFSVVLEQRANKPINPRGGNVRY